MHVAVRVLHSYAFIYFLAGYVQGMSDLLAPLLAVMENEVDTFWCFVGFMDTVVSRLSYLVLMGHCREGGRGDTCHKQYCSQRNFKLLYMYIYPIDIRVDSGLETVLYIWVMECVINYTMSCICRSITLR